MPKKIIVSIITLMLLLSFAGCGMISAEDIDDLASQVIGDIQQQTTSADSAVQTEYFDEAPTMPKPDENKGYTFVSYGDEIYIYSLPYDSELASQLFADYLTLLMMELNFSINMPTEAPCFAVYKPYVPYYEKEILAVVLMTVEENEVLLYISFNDEANAQYNAQYFQ